MTLYVIGYAHLDTQWRWAYPLTIGKFIRKTLVDNFTLLDKYPFYIFNFTGSRRYAFMKEYYPEHFARVRGYIADRRWFPAGSSVDEGDVLVSGLESQVRQILYGNRFFQKEFQLQSNEVMLPDTFGFPACLPSILAHCGIRGFSTQKLSWGSAAGIPFDLGMWEGVDGKKIIAALNPGKYDSKIETDLSNDASWIGRIQKNGEATGIYADFRYYGVGDRGGSVTEESLRWLQRSIISKGKLEIVSAPANRLFDDLSEDETDCLPVYKGDLLLTGHSTGSLTSNAIMKRLNRKNELLANAAETAATIAFVLDALPYPTEQLYRAWDLVLGSQMHDTLPGTCVPKAYEFAWNDEVLALNLFSSVTETSSAAVIAGMDTRASNGGISIVVYNPVSLAREDVVEASFHLSFQINSSITVHGPDGEAVPTQIISQVGDYVTILFLANAPPLGYVVYEARPSVACPVVQNLRCSERLIENERYCVAVNENGDISSIFDKRIGKELLKTPAQLVFQFEKPKKWPAWNMDWIDRQRPPETIVRGAAEIKVIESGPVRATLEVKRYTRGSSFTQQIRLAAGKTANRVEIATKIDWRSLECSLKASFTFNVSNPLASYDAQIGAIQRGNNDSSKFEVPQHQWMDLTDEDGSYGVAILNDSKYGSDKPDDFTLRLTLLYSPGVSDKYQDQATQDMGHHEMLYAIQGHVGDWREGETTWEAARLNQPLLSFFTPSHPGPLGKTFSLFKTNSNQAQIVSIKKAEDSDEIIVRIKELWGRPANGLQLIAELSLVTAREVNGQEIELGPAVIQDGALLFDLSYFQVRAFAIKLSAWPSLPKASLPNQPLSLPYDLDAVSSNGTYSQIDFDGRGRSYPAEQFPETIISGGVSFRLGSSGKGKRNALTCLGNELLLPEGTFNRLYILASSVNGDQKGSLQIDDLKIPWKVQDWCRFIGQWDKRLWQGKVSNVAYEWTNRLDGLVCGYIKRAPVVWHASHRHNAKQGDEFYQYAYLYKYGFNIFSGMKRLVLPKNDKIRVFAVSVANEPWVGVSAASLLYAPFNNHVISGLPELFPKSGTFLTPIEIIITPPFYHRKENLRYTTDGTNPTINSALYQDGIFIDKDTVVKVCEFDLKGAPGPVVIEHYNVTLPGYSNVHSHAPFIDN